MKRRIFEIFKRELNQNEKLIKNIEEYDKKEKAGKQKSKVLAKRKARRTKN